MFFIGTIGEKAEYLMLKLWQRRTQKRSNIAGSQSGQGTLEYILVLLIVVIIILSVVYRFNTSFRVYAEAFFDGYIACLLETGELPGVPNSQCMDEFKDFDPKAGKAYLSGNLPGDSGKGAAGGAGKNDSANKDSAGKGNTETAGSRSGGSSYVGTLSDSGRFKTSVVSRSSEAPPTSATEAGGNDTNSSFGGSSSSIGRVQGDSRRDRVVMVYDSSLDSSDAKDPSRAKTQKVARKDTSEDRLRPTKATETGQRGPAAKQIDATGDFSIGALVRLFIIILIVVAMIIFFGGQLMQIARSQEKGGDG